MNNLNMRSLICSPFSQLCHAVWGLTLASLFLSYAVRCGDSLHDIKYKFCRDWWGSNSRSIYHTRGVFAIHYTVEIVYTICFSFLRRILVPYTVSGDSLHDISTVKRSAPPFLSYAVRCGDSLHDISTVKRSAPPFLSYAVRCEDSLHDISTVKRNGVRTHSTTYLQ
jgi:hypothetical protein